jgi:hypothetical protein
MEKLTKIINEWDPVNLMVHAPYDEYEIEVEKVMKAAELTGDEFELAKTIMSIFLESFGGESFTKTMDECVCIARKVLKE